MVVQEAYIVGDVKVEFAKRKFEATLTRDTQVKTVQGKDRQKLLIAVGDTLADEFGVENSAIYGLYNVVHLR